MRNMNILYYIYLSFQTLYVRITYIHEKTYINFIHTEILILILNSDHLQYSILVPTLFAQWTKGQWPHGQWPCAIHPNCATLVTCLSQSESESQCHCQWMSATTLVTGGWWWPLLVGDGQKESNTANQISEWVKAESWDSGSLPRWYHVMVM